MNIIEAVKSGKKFKRPHWPAFVLEAEMREPVDGYYEILPEDLIADDYEVEELKVTITRAQLYTAWLDTEDRFINMGVDRRGYFKELLARELGL